MIWPKEVTLVSRSEPSGPLCFWQSFKLFLPFQGGQGWQKRLKELKEDGEQGREGRHGGQKDKTER